MLLAWLDDLFGCESNRALLTDLTGATEGFHASGCNFIDHHLIVRGDAAELREREDDEEALSDERREQLQRKLERARLKLGMPEHREEIRRVKQLLGLAKRIRVDSKAQGLRQFVRGLLDKAPQEKLLIFTEHTEKE